MKKTIFLTATVAAMALASSCSDEQTFGSGQGKVLISTTINSDMTVVSRSLADELSGSTRIWISSKSGLVRRYDNLADLPTEPIDLHSGSYVAEGWAGDSVPASWDQRWFKAYVPFTVNDNATTNVDLALKIANVAVSVRYDDAVSEVLHNCVMTVGHTGGELVFDAENGARRGYFMMPSASRDLNYKLTAEQPNGTPFEFGDVIHDAKAATEYVLHVKYVADNSEIGGGYFTIVVDEHEIEVKKEVSVVAPPSFTGYGFDLNRTVSGSKGTIGRRTIYVTSASQITTFEIDGGESFTSIIGGPDVELFHMQQSVKDALEAGGINFVNTYDADTDNTIFQLNFEPEFTDALNDGTYTFTMKATDREGRVGTATLTILVSDATISTEALAADDMGIYTNRATVSATINKPGAAEYGFKYRKAGASEWQSVTATPQGDTYSVELTGLEAGTAYEYAAYADDFVAATMRFTTEAAAQIPNAGFEDWDTSTSTYLIHAPGGEMYWDSGNHGATTMPGASSITTPDGDLKHSGNYSAKLYSKFVGISIIGKFAAGNIFAGQYLNTDGTDGILGWGRPFASRPSAVRMWVKYTPGIAVDKKGANDSYIPAGQPDKGIIYMALTDGTTDSYEFKENTYVWPFVIRTKNSSTDPRRLFDKNEERVIAYGEHVFETATEGDGLVEITIPLDYFRTDARPSNLIFVGSASRYGDFFSGGEGSTLWIDDIELIYE